MDNYKLEYWIESVAATTEEIGYNLSIEDITTIVESMIITAEQESLAFGYDAIPNPLQTEIDEITNKLERERTETAQRTYLSKKYRNTKWCQCRRCVY